MLNSCTAVIAGMHKEEVLARLAAHDAPISFLPLDYLSAPPSRRVPRRRGRTRT